MTTTNKHIDYLDRILDGVPDTRRFRIRVVWNLRVGGYWKNHTGNYVNDLRMLFVKGGEGYYRVDGVHVPLKRGFAAFLNTGVTFIHDHNPDDPPVLIPCRFDLLDSRSGALIPSPAPPFWTPFMVEDSTHYEELFEALHAAYAHGDEAVCGSMLHVILTTMRHDLAKQTRADFDHRIERVRRYIAQNPLCSDSSAELARRAGLSPAYFARKFTAQVGVSPKGFRLRAKMDYARMMLEQTDAPVKAVAMDLGYSDQFVFSRQFRKVHGIPPSEVAFPTRSH